MKKFFIVCPLGFELTVVEEIQEFWPLLVAKDGRPVEQAVPAIKVEKGGVEINCEEILGFQLNFFLKTASRVLLRLAEFKVRDFPKLHEKIKNIPWQEYFSSANLNYEISASKSRLNHEGRIEETFVKTLKPILKAESAEAEGSIYVRIFDDLCTISLDTSGEHLHKRGWAQLKGEAPLRESIAAFILRQLVQKNSIEQLKKITICDPMMGSGSFLLEARALKHPNVGREFAFRKFKSCPKLLLSPSFALNYKLTPSLLFKGFLGSDLDAKIVDVAQKNWQSLETEIEKIERKSYMKASVELAQKDLFSDFNKVAAKTWIVINPPYGERLQDGAGGNINDYFAALASSEAEKIAVLFLASQPLGKKQCPDGYKITAEIPVLNGGLKTLLTVLTRRTM